MFFNRLILILVATSLLNSQEFSSPKIGRSNTPKPKFPVVDYNACPGKGKIVPNFKISENDRMNLSWRGKRRLVGTLKAGEVVTILEGVNLVLEPEKAVIKFVGPDLDSSLNVGDVALGFGVEADANVVFWSKGVWFAEWIEAVAEKGACGFTSGFGQGGCSIDIIKDGVSEWWVHVKTSSGRTGWVLAEKFTDSKRWYGTNFSNLCHYGED